MDNNFTQDFKDDLADLLDAVDFEINDYAEDQYREFFEKYPELKS